MRTSFFKDLSMATKIERNAKCRIQLRACQCRGSAGRRPPAFCLPRRHILNWREFKGAHLVRVIWLIRVHYSYAPGDQMRGTRNLQLSWRGRKCLCLESMRPVRLPYGHLGINEDAQNNKLLPRIWPTKLINFNSNPKHTLLKLNELVNTKLDDNYWVEF